MVSCIYPLGAQLLVLYTEMDCKLTWSLRLTMLESTTHRHQYHVLNESSTPPALRHWCYFGLVHLNDWDMNLDLLPKNRQFTQIFIIGDTSFRRLSDIDIDERDVDSFLEDLAECTVTARVIGTQLIGT